MIPRGRNPDPFAVLGVSHGADLETIRKAYRRLSQRLHPDRHANDPEFGERFHRVQEAWEILSDPQRRKPYDEAWASSSVEDLDAAIASEIDSYLFQCFSGEAGEGRDF